MKVFNDLKTRDINDILIAVTDGLNGVPEALAAVFPVTAPQTCIVHLIRNSLDYASWKDRRRTSCSDSPNLQRSQHGTGSGRTQCVCRRAVGKKFPTVTAAWRNARYRVIPFFALAPAARNVINTTNAIENINSRLRKIIKTRGHLPTDEAATKLIWLAPRNITADWGRAAHDW